MKKAHSKVPEGPSRLFCNIFLTDYVQKRFAMHIAKSKLRITVIAVFRVYCFTKLLLEYWVLPARSWFYPSVKLSSTTRFQATCFEFVPILLCLKHFSHQKRQRTFTGIYCSQPRSLTLLEIRWALLYFPKSYRKKLDVTIVLYWAVKFLKFWKAAVCRLHLFLRIWHGRKR